ncbi:MAG TPA: XRE family transcriptional regulator [Clostridiales bacterium]|jgi:transcriptional regulator with XRE-family HTH domain|nr:XRE family transcriptional regulator [Clostridiales bacterium]
MVLDLKGLKTNLMLTELGFNQSLLSDMKRYNTVPASDKLAKIADYLDISVDYLLGRTDKPEVNK